MRLYQAIVISLLGHGALLLPHAGQPLPDVPVTSMQVRLSSGSSQPAAHEPELHGNFSTKKTASPAQEKTDPKPAVNEAKQRMPELDNRHTEKLHYVFRSGKSGKAHTAALNTSLSDTLSRQQAQVRIVSRLRHELKNYFEYPLLAKRNGWEGKVILAMDIYLDGRIYNIQLKSGSGHNVLDHSALKAVSRIQTISDVPSWKGSSPLNIAIPVIYRLQG